MDWVGLIFTLAKVFEQPLNSVEVIPGGLEEWATTEVPDNAGRPTADFPFMLVDGHLGVPKKVLYALYLAAVKQFRGSTLPGMAEANPDALRRCESVSIVILLANPAHQTALNLRKRLVLCGFLPISRELQLIETLLCSSDNWAKESIIWDHRRWLLKRSYSQINFDSLVKPPPITDKDDERLRSLKSSPMIPLQVIQQEYDLIRRACTIYPRNYHAWSHWRCLTDALYSLMATSGAKFQHLAKLVGDEFTNIRRWVDGHVSDHSAVHQLHSTSLKFFKLAKQHPDCVDSSFLVELLDPLVLADHAISLLSIYPLHESLWLYLRGTLTAIAESERASVVSRLKGPSLANTTLADRTHFWLNLKVRFGTMSVCNLHKWDIKDTNDAHVNGAVIRGVMSGMAAVE